VRTAFLSLIVWVPQDAAELARRLEASLAEHHREMPEQERKDVARRFADGIVRARAFGHEPARVLGRVEYYLARGLSSIRSTEAHGRALGSGLDAIVPDAAERLALPADFIRQGREAQLDFIDAYLSEALARAPADEVGKRALREQLATVRDEIRATALSRLSGPYREGVIDAILGPAFKDQSEEELGDPLAGAASRPLSASEMAVLVDSLRREAASLPAADASSAADETMARTGQTPDGLDTPAVALAARLTRHLYRFVDFNYPRLTTALERRERIAEKAAQWVKDAWAPIEKELESQGRKVSRPPSPSTSGHRLPADVAPPAPSTERPRAPTAGTSGRPWAIGAVLAIVAVAVIAALLRRHRGS
jgi:hypothetical protein